LNTNKNTYLKECWLSNSWWAWANDDKFFILGWTIPLKGSWVSACKVREMLGSQSTQHVDTGQTKISS